MPFYEIQHVIPITASQKDELAMAITEIHSTTFSTPKLFVNVCFTDTSEKDTYVAGKRRKANHIRADVRNNASRTREDWTHLCAELQKAWDHIIGPGLPKVKRGDPDQDTSLRSLVLLGGLIHGTELGFTLPPAGKDREWLQENWEEFNKRAEAGDQDMADMVAEVKKRHMVNGSDGQTAQQKLEEAMGWGEYA
jgi:phenylpyruvate tautomerase PptA (4-oxalocrotonate tautomerase family)